MVDLICRTTVVDTAHDSMLLTVFYCFSPNKSFEIERFVSLSVLTDTSLDLWSVYSFSFVFVNPKLLDFSVIDSVVVAIFVVVTSHQCTLFFSPP